MSSCSSANYVTHTSDKCELGSREGKASSYQLGYFVGWGGPKATLKHACQDGNITTIYHVEETRKNYFFGLVQKKTTRVYGE